MIKRATLSILAPILAFSSPMMDDDEDDFVSQQDTVMPQGKKMGAQSCPYLTWESWGDFLYWQPIQENMEPAGLITSLLLNGFTGPGDTGVIINMNFDYKPAFAIGVGTTFAKTFEVDAIYTRFYSTQTSAASGNQYYPMQLDPSILLSFLNGISVAAGYGGAAPYSYSQTWNLEMNFFDLEFARYKCEQKNIQLRPFIGLRAAWIDQTLDANYTANLVSGGAQVGTAEIYAKTGSWGIGIRGGIDANCKLGAGFKFYSCGAGDLLYTKYHWHGTENTNVPTGLVDRNASVSQQNIMAVRLHLDTEVGILWGYDFNGGKVCPQGRFDIGAGYGFQIFFDQNMFRHFTTTFEEIGLVGGVPVLTGALAAPISNLPNGNLYLQGLRLHGSFSY